MSRTLALLTPWLLAGCLADEDQVGTIEQHLVMPNGDSLNGVSQKFNPNLVMPNDPNLVMPNDTDLVMPNGVALNGLDLIGVGRDGSLIGISTTSTPLSGESVVGSMWKGRLTNGRAIAIRVDEAMQGSGTNSDVWSYRFSFKRVDGWQPLCVDTAGNSIFADTVTGSWNLAEGVPGGGSYHPHTDKFTVACRGTAVAKCVELGYKPWTGHSDEMASCVRAVRADFCGDGTPFTVHGTLINLFDDDGIQSDSVDWVPEAEWHPDGATCVSKKKNTRFWQVAHQKPWCFPVTLKPESSCGAGFSGEAKVITELPPT